MLHCRGIARVTLRLDRVVAKAMATMSIHDVGVSVRAADAQAASGSASGTGTSANQDNITLDPEGFGVGPSGDFIPAGHQVVGTSVGTSTGLALTTVCTIMQLSNLSRPASA